MLFLYIYSVNIYFIVSLIKVGKPDKKAIFKNFLGVLIMFAILFIFMLLCNFEHVFRVLQFNLLGNVFLFFFIKSGCFLSFL